MKTEVDFINHLDELYPNQVGGLNAAYLLKKADPIMYENMLREFLENSNKSTHKDIKVPKLSVEQIMMIKQLTKDYPIYKNFKFWLCQNKIHGQKFEDKEYVGSEYEFDFDNKTVKPVR